MKEPSLSRLRKNSANPSRKLKLVCSFNGAFRPRPPSGKLRYVGGETRIISIDRNIGFLKLRAKIADLCPKVMSFELKYLVAVADVDLDMGLVVMESDEDVKCMVEEYENLELYGKRARLWVFVCSNVLEYEKFCKDHVGNKVTKNVGNGGNGLRLSDNSLRKMVLKQQLLAKQKDRINANKGVSGFGFNESGLRFACCGKSQKFDQQLINLGSEEPRGLVSDEETLGGNLLDCEMRNLGPQMCLLKPRDGNLGVINNGSMQFLPGQSGGVLCHEPGIGRFDGASEGLKQQKSSGVISMCNDFDGRHDLRSSELRPLSNCNTENIMPWDANSVNTHFKPVYYKKHPIIKLDGRRSSGKYCLWKHWPGLPEHASSEEVSTMNHLSNPDFPYDNSNPKACHLPHYGGWAGVGSQSVFTNNVMGDISMMDTKQCLMFGLNYGLAVPYQTPFKNCHGGAIVCEPFHCDIQNRRSDVDSQDVITDSALSNDVCNTHLSGAEACKNLKSKYKDRDSTHNLQGGIASSVDLLCILSMSSSKGVQPPALYSHGSDKVSDSLVMPQSRPLDLMDKVLKDTGPQVDQSSGNTSNSSPTNMDELKKNHIQGEETQNDLPSDLSIDEESEAKDGRKCSKVVGRISSGLTAFYTQELQTIRSSDPGIHKRTWCGCIWKGVPWKMEGV